MKFVKKIKKLRRLKTYSFAKLINESGTTITRECIYYYELDKCKSMKLEVLCAMRRVGGLSWAELGKLLDAEFLKG